MLTNAGSGVWKTEPMMVSSLCALVVLGPAADLKPTFEARYRQYNEAVAKNDGKAMAGWYERNAAPKFTYTSKSGYTYGRKDFIAGQIDQAHSIKKAVKSTFKIVKVVAQGKSATAIVSTEFEGLANFNGAVLKLVDKSTTRDVWTQGKSGWQIVKSVQVQSDTQMFNAN